MKKFLLALLLLAGLGAACSQSTVPTAESNAPAPVLLSEQRTFDEETGYEFTDKTTVEELNAWGVVPALPTDPQIVGGRASYAQVEDVNYNGQNWLGAQRIKSENTGYIQGPGSCPGGAGKETYQSTWASYNAGNDSWLEMGTARLCNGTRAWFGFYAKNYVAGSGGLTGGIWAYWIPITGYTTHQSTMIRDGNNCRIWWFLIDTYAAAQTIDLGACYHLTEIKSGIEAYQPGAVLWGPGATMTNHQKLIGGAWSGTSWDSWWNGDPETYLYLGGFDSMCATQNAAVPSGC